MKYSIDVHEFSFNKIKNGSRKIGIHLFDKKAQQIKIGDTLDMRNASTGEHLECLIKGIGLFDNFDDAIDALGPLALGYTDKKELMVRLERMYPRELQQELNAVTFFLEPLFEKKYLIGRGEKER